MNMNCDIKGRERGKGESSKRIKFCVTVFPYSICDLVAVKSRVSYTVQFLRFFELVCTDRVKPAPPFLTFPKQIPKIERYNAAILMRYYSQNENRGTV